MPPPAKKAKTATEGLKRAAEGGAPDAKRVREAESQPETAAVIMKRAQRAYVSVVASTGGVDGAGVPRTAREAYIALHRVYGMRPMQLRR